MSNANKSDAEMEEQAERVSDFNDKYFHRDRYEKSIDDLGIIGELHRLSYSIFGDWFEDNADSFYWIKQNLIYAQNGVNIDLYMSKMLIWLIIFTVIGVPAGLVFGIGVLGPLLSEFIPTVASAFIGLFIGLLAFPGLTAGIFIGVPWYRAGERKRRINATMPFAITFMYALSRGGMDFIEILETLSDSEDAYGEVAREVQPLVREMDLFATDFQRALRNAGFRTPSQQYEDFMDDLISVFDSGANLTNFLEQAAEESREQAAREQQNFIQVLELMGEVYVTVFVAGPLFLIIITVVMSMLGGGGGGQLYGIIYGLLPVMNVGFFVLIEVISIDEGGLASTLESTRKPLSIEYTQDAIEEVGDYEEFQTIEDYKKSKARRDFISSPFSYMIETPAYSLPFTIPIAILIPIVTLLLGAAVPSVDGFIQSPVANTTYLITGPLLVMMIPYMIFHEIGMRRNNRMMQRLPEALKQLASANSIGLTLTEALTTVSKNTSGRLGSEMGKVSNDIQWNYNVNEGMIALANRLRVPVLTRTVKLITKANESSGDIEDVLSVAATDVSKRHQLKKERQTQMMMYTVVVLISFTVYLFVIVLLDVTFLSKFAEFGTGGSGGGTTAGGSAGGGGGLDFSGLPIQQIRLAFFHSTIVQSLGSGLLAGQLGSNNVKNGIKFSVALMILSSIVFAAI